MQTPRSGESAEEKAEGGERSGSRKRRWVPEEWNRLSVNSSKNPIPGSPAIPGGPRPLPTPPPPGRAGSPHFTFAPLSHSSGTTHPGLLSPSPAPSRRPRRLPLVPSFGPQFRVCGPKISPCQNPTLPPCPPRPSEELGGPRSTDRTRFYLGEQGPHSNQSPLLFPPPG